MPDPMDRAVMEALIARAGLPLTEAELASVHGASHHIAALAARLRPVAGGVSVEPATVFVPR